jgi:hypothetical protein
LAEMSKQKAIGGCCLVFNKIKYWRKKKWIDVFFGMQYNEKDLDLLDKIREILAPYALLLGWGVRTEVLGEKGDMIDGIIGIFPKSQEMLSAEELRDKKKDFFAIASSLCEKLYQNDGVRIEIRSIPLDKNEKRLDIVHIYGVLYVRYKLDDRIEFDNLPKQRKITREIFKQDLESYCSFLAKEKQTALVKRGIAEVLKHIKSNERLELNHLPQKSRFVTEKWTERGEEHLGIRRR